MVDNAINTIQLKQRSSFTEGWRDSREALLKNLVTDDDDETETTWQRLIRNMTQVPLAIKDDPPFTYAEITSAIKRIKSCKVPGIDNMDPKIINRVISTVWSTCVTTIFNGCLKFGVFTAKWKQGIIWVLLKESDKDPRLASSYRPICLLAVLSRLLEIKKLFVRETVEDN